MSRKKIIPTEKEMEIAKRLKEERLKNNLTLDEVASQMNLSKTTISRYENLDITNIPIDKIEKLAKIYNTTPANLMGWNELQSELYEDLEILKPFSNYITSEKMELAKKIMSSKSLEDSFSKVDKYMLEMKKNEIEKIIDEKKIYTITRNYDKTEINKNVLLLLNGEYCPVKKRINGLAFELINLITKEKIYLKNYDDVTEIGEILEMADNLF